jgi:hypothetical protein
VPRPQPSSAPASPARASFKPTHADPAGLINQHYSHIAAFSLAAVLGADVVLPPAVCRDSFGHYFHTSKEKNQVQWLPIPTDKILDVEGITKTWARLGIRVLPVRWLPRQMRGRAGRGWGSCRGGLAPVPTALSGRLLVAAASVQ